MFEDLLKEFPVSISAISGAIGAVLGWTAKRWLDIRRHRDDWALEACIALRQHLAKWNSGIAAAVADGKTVDEVKERLQAFMQGAEFEPRLATLLPRLRSAPECRNALALIDAFHSAALATKEYVHSNLHDPIFYSDFSKHRAIALAKLREPLEACNVELERIMVLMMTRQTSFFAFRTVS